ncbi:hypothetical protein H1C71_005258, partial [Ictidomys tridecemlineatus]
APAGRLYPAPSSALRPLTRAPPPPRCPFSGRHFSWRLLRFGGNRDRNLLLDYARYACGPRVSLSNAGIRAIQTWKASSFPGPLNLSPSSSRAGRHHPALYPHPHLGDQTGKASAVRGCLPLLCQDVSV